MRYALCMLICTCVYRDDALEARRVARENLMKLVDAGRQEQIRNKLEQLDKEREEDAVFASSFVEDAKAGMVVIYTLCLYNTMGV